MHLIGHCRMAKNDFEKYNGLRISRGADGTGLVTVHGFLIRRVTPKKM